MHKLSLLLVATAATGLVSATGVGFEKPGIGHISSSGIGVLNPSFDREDPITVAPSISFSLPGPYIPHDPEPSVVTAIDYFSCPKYGPFNIGDDDFEATFAYRAYIDDQQVFERLRIMDYQGRYVYAHNNPSINYRDNELIETTFTIPIKDHLTNNGFTLKFEIVSKSNNSILKAYSALLYPLQSLSYDANYLKSYPVYSRPIGFYGDGSAMQSISEAYDFRDLGDYLNNDYYYYLKIKDNNFYYTSDFPLTYTSINLKFEDHDHLFPYLNHDSSSFVSIPLRATVKNEKVTLNYKNYFYVNKKTLDVSATYRQGLALTNEFYLPINGKNQFNDKLMYLEFVEFGKSKINVTFPIRYQVDKSLVGASDDGLNYVTGGIRQ